MHQPENNFGPLRADYKLARRGYPEEVYAYLRSLVPQEHPLTLDLGCGTGISTRELQRHGFRVLGGDKDPDMIAAAKEDGGDIQYAVASAEKLPFPDGHFDLVSAFTAFHWFNEARPLKEIRRVLKPEGWFFAALKSNQENEEAAVFNKGYQAILRKYAGPNFDSTYKHFNKEHLQALFQDVRERSFPVDEAYSVEDALALLRSLSIWNLVPVDRRPALLGEMEAFYRANLVNGLVIRKREIFTIAARN